MADRRVQPPRAAIALLVRILPLDDRDPILGDLLETFDDRAAAGRRFNALWFWAVTLAFVVVRRKPLEIPSGGHMSSVIATSLRQAIRRLRFEWRYAAGIVAILAIGIGPAAALLSVVNRVLLRPLAYADPERLAIVRIQLGQVTNHPGLAMDEVGDLRGMTDVFAGVEAEDRAADASLGPPDQLEAVTTVSMTPGMLSMIGVMPAYGRPFNDDDVGEGKAPPILLDYGFWQRRFGGSQAVIGTNLIVDGRPAQVVGVMPEGFTLVTGRAVPQPFDLYRALRLRASRNFWAFPTIVRLRPGVTIEQANAHLQVLTANLLRTYPKEYSDAKIAFAVHPLLDDLTRDSRPAFAAAVGGVLLLLLIAVSNATALTVARLSTRAQDLALRGALGAGRAALVLEVLVESALLSALGAAAGSVLAAAAISGVRAIVPHTLPRWQEIAVGWDVVLFATLLALAGLVLIGLLPVIKVSRGAPWQALRIGSIQGGRAEGARSRLVLVGAQVALMIVLVFGAVQLVRSAIRLSHVDLGYDANVMTVRVPVNFRQFQNPGEALAMYQRVRDRLASIDRVESVGAVSHAPLSGTARVDSFSRDFSREPGWDAPVANYYAVLPGYFNAMKIPIVQGRDISDAEDMTGQKVVVVDELLAKIAFPELENVIGQRLNVGYQMGPATIVGVVKSVRSVEIGRIPRPQLYAPMSTFFWTPLNFTIRATGDPMALRAAVTSAIREIGPGAALSGFSMLTDNVAQATSTLRAVTGFVTVLAISAGVLSAVGLYIVIAFVMHQRRRSTAIRFALGAGPGRLLWDHLKTSGAVVLLALPFGVGFALAAAPLFSALVYGIGVRDALSLAIASLAALAAGFAGIYVPVRRAGRANIVTDLRSD